MRPGRVTFKFCNEQLNRSRDNSVVHKLQCKQKLSRASYIEIVEAWRPVS